MKVTAKTEVGRKARKVSEVRVWKMLKEHLSKEQLGVFMQSLPPQIYAEVFTSKNPEQFWGRYLLGNRVEEYLSADATMRKIIAAQVIAQHIMRSGLTVPEKIQKLASKTPGTRGPRIGSKRQKYKYILLQTRELIKNPTLEHIIPYLKEVEAAMEKEINRLEAIKQNVKNSNKNKNE